MHVVSWYHDFTYYGEFDVDRFKMPKILISNDKK